MRAKQAKQKGRSLRGSGPVSLRRRRWGIFARHPVGRWQQSHWEENGKPNECAKSESEANADANVGSVEIHAAEIGIQIGCRARVLDFANHTLAQAIRGADSPVIALPAGINITI